MAGDNAELTFVRCPSCRSLVPAISTKCRMCGATFENGQAEEEKPRSPSGRVRQHTTSVATGIEPPPSPAAPQRPAPISAPIPTAGFGLTSDVAEKSSPDVDDPLRSYVEEVQVGENERPPSSNGVNAHEGYTEPKIAAPIAPPPPMPMKSAPTPPSPAQVVVESGRGKPGGLSFGRPEIREQRKPEPAQRNIPETKEAREPAPRQEPVSKPAQAPRHEPPAQRQPVPQPPRREEKREERAEQRQPQQERRVEPSRSASKIQATDGGLVGWLVDYRDQRGAGIELREGQFFVSRTRLKDSDLIIDHGSISTPHALVRATKQNGVELQDLMSERGIKIRRHSSSSWQNVEERVKLGHGDRVQFGEVEYLLVLIPAD